jgi:hypothetical protein
MAAAPASGVLWGKMNDEIKFALIIIFGTIAGAISALAGFYLASFLF